MKEELDIFYSDDEKYKEICDRVRVSAYMNDHTGITYNVNKGCTIQIKDGTHAIVDTNLIHFNIFIDGDYTFCHYTFLEDWINSAIMSRAEYEYVSTYIADFLYMPLDFFRTNYFLWTALIYNT